MYRLIDVEVRKGWEPERFFFPPRLARETVAPGWLVKLVFELDRPPAGFGKGERLPVRVVARVSTARGIIYSGTVIGDPMTPGIPKYGHVVTFEPQHISGVFPPDQLTHEERPSDAARR
jgi:hypothetical protein